MNISKCVLLSRVLISHRLKLSSIVGSDKNTSTISKVVNAFKSQRKEVTLDDIRSEPYVTKGVYTKSGAIRPVIELFYTDEIVF